MGFNASYANSDYSYLHNQFDFGHDFDPTRICGSGQSQFQNIFLGYKCLYLEPNVLSSGRDVPSVLSSCTQFYPLDRLWCQIITVYAARLNIYPVSVVILSFLGQSDLLTLVLVVHLCILNYLVLILGTY